MKIKVFVNLLFCFVLACTAEPIIMPVTSTSTTTMDINPTLTTTPSLDCKITFETISKQNLIDEKLLLSGILYKPNHLSVSPSYIFDLKSGEYVPILQDENRQILDTTFAVSSNGQYLAYVDIDLNENSNASTILHIVNANGVEENKFLLGFRPGNAKWINDNEMYIEKIQENLDAITDKPDAGLLIINKNDGKILEVPNEYPGQWNGDNLFWDFTLSRVVFNSSFTRVIYPTYVDPNRIIRLVDTENNQVVVDIPTTDYGKFPTWSYDDKKLAYVTQMKQEASWSDYQDEIFIVSDVGDISQVTSISESTNYSYITGLAWSPDNRYIAFWVNNSNWEEGYKGVHLSIVDTQTKDISQYCNFKGIDGKEYIPLSGNPIWSLDGKHLALNLVDREKEEQNIVIIFDIALEKAYHIADEFLAIGWMK
ncbi:MAG: PD40 domain-containing protein [Anaerolineales bacterium]|nr:PD40 domain-containing protein [Anaerolineales bacterium]